VKISRVTRKASKFQAIVTAVREFTKRKHCEGVMEKILSGKLFIADFIFGDTPVSSRQLHDLRRLF